MATISGMQGMSNEQINFELQQGAKIVRYNFCISLLIVSFKRTSLHFIKAGESRITPGLPFTLLSLFLGWWGIPWGPIWTIQALVVNFGGGTDVTQQVLAAVAPRATPTPQRVASQSYSQGAVAPPPPPPPALR